jgi:Receptor L domain
MLIAVFLIFIQVNIVREMEQSLSAIEEIDGYLKVVRSFPLLSLSFLKRLKLITGKTTDSQQRSLVIMDNQNLQDLWDEGQQVRVESGLIFFYFNPKLCFYKISNFIKQSTKGVDDHTMSTFRATNGEKTACNVTLLDVKEKKPETNSANSVILSWDALEIDDDRTLLGYVVYYIVAPFQNVTMYDGRDACGGDGYFLKIFFKLRSILNFFS